MGVYPFGGPLSGGSSVKINATGLTQKSACDIRVRFSTREVAIAEINADTL